MNGESGTSSTGNVNYYYKCASRKKDRNGCRKKSVRKDDIENLVIRASKDLFRSSEQIDRIASSVFEILRKQMRDKSILNLLKDDRTQKQKALANLLKAVEEGLATSTTKNRMLELEDAIDELDRKILEEESKEDNLITKDAIVDFLTALPEKDQQFIIDTAIRKVVLFDNKIEIHYNFITPTDPFDPDGSSPEDCRDNSLSAKSSFLCVVPPKETKIESVGFGFFFL